MKNNQSSFIYPEVDDVGQIIRQAWSDLGDETASLENMLVTGQNDTRATVAERAAYAALLLSQPHLASEVIQRSLAEKRDDLRPFVLESLRRMRIVGEELARDDLLGARRILDHWTSASRAHLGLSASE
ncbi:hypothetical protein [Subtercola vilae]|uniref:hypothetical protein n=1 Tax=Subtercola vilae TaxID=2056433 RepID=UPI0010AA9CDB|nr:hypothetical protein [Subtercola vilae]